jgi:hypothetical protein
MLVREKVIHPFHLKLKAHFSVCQLVFSVGLSAVMYPGSAQIMTKLPRASPSSSFVWRCWPGVGATVCHRSPALPHLYGVWHGLFEIEMPPTMPNDNGLLVSPRTIAPSASRLPCVRHTRRYGGACFERVARVAVSAGRVLPSPRVGDVPPSGIWWVASMDCADHPVPQVSPFPFACPFSRSLPPFPFVTPCCPFPCRTTQKKTRSPTATPGLDGHSMPSMGASVLLIRSAGPHRQSCKIARCRLR